MQIKRDVVEAGLVRVYFDDEDVTPMVMEADDGAGTAILWLRTNLTDPPAAVTTPQKGRVCFI